LSEEFKTISLVIDTSSPRHPTLTIHVDGKEASSLVTVLRYCSLNTMHILNTNTILIQIFEYWQQWS